MELWLAILLAVVALIVGYGIGCLTKGTKTLSSTTSCSVSQYGESIWMWRADTWHMVLDLSKAGCVAGPAPTRRGAFEFEAVRVVSVRRS